MIGFLKVIILRKYISLIKIEFLGVLKRIKEQAINRTVKLSSEIKQTSDWTMNKVIRNVLESKRQKRLDKKRKEQLQKEQEAFRHQLATHNVIDSLSKWLTKKASMVIKEHNPEQYKKLSSIKNRKNRRIAPSYNFINVQNKA